MFRGLSRGIRIATVGLLLLAPALIQAEYGDVILNRYAEENGMRPVIFPHWFHRIRFRCKVCHHELGFEMRAPQNLPSVISPIVTSFAPASISNPSSEWQTRH